MDFAFHFNQITLFFMLLFVPLNSLVFRYRKGIFLDIPECFMKLATKFWLSTLKNWGCMA